jgi:Fe2+ transport system protein B
MISVREETKEILLKIYKEKGICLEGNILKVIKSEGDDEFSKYLDICSDRDKETRRKRLDITKKVQDQNKELQRAKEEIERINEELKESLTQTQKAKDSIQYDLDVLQKKTQYELINTIVKIALFVIVGVGLTTTILYIISIFTGKDTQIISSTWSNMFGILLTNAFSIVGTIMGVKYANKDEK